MNRLLEAIAQTTEQATSMTRSLLALSRDGHVALQPVDLPAVLRDAAELLRRLLPARIEFTTDIPDGRDMWINSEPSMIRQLLINLAVNARDAMPDGGVLKVSLSPPNRRAAADAGDAFARVCVEDTGVGMDAQVRQRVFEPFFTTKPRGAGTGLGLAVVRGIVSFHSGHVDIASQPGQGTRVTVHLPLCAAPPAPRATQRPSRQAAGNVLVVERDEHVAAIIAATLQAAGHEVVQAGTADQACASLQSHRKQKTPPIDLVILDTDGPSSDPFRCLRRIREIEAKLPVIATVGNVDPTVRCRLAQRTALLPKPFQMADLTELVQELLRPIP